MTTLMADSCKNLTTPWRDISTAQKHEALLTPFIQMLENHLPYMANRSQRLDQAGQVLGQKLGMDAQTLYILSVVLRFHDIGLLGVPSEIVLKQGPLTPEEQAKLNQHTDIGGRLMAKCFSGFPEVSEGIWYHHERPDGKGPRGLKGDEIPMIAQIVSVLSAMESMANNRPFRLAMPLPKIMDDLSFHAGYQFFGNLVKEVQEISQNLYEILIVPKSL